MKIHDCPTCTCRPSPQTCWTCRWAAPETEGEAPCYIGSPRENPAAVKWYDEHVDEDTEQAAIDAPPCPGWEEAA